MDVTNQKIEETFVFSAGAKKKISMIFGLGVILLIIGIVFLNSGGHDDHHAMVQSASDLASIAEGGHGEHGGVHHAAYHWTQRIWANMWINNVFFTGIALAAVFFIAFNYVATSGWYAGLKRVPEAFGSFLPIGGVLMLLVFFIGGHDIFHWTHEGIMDPEASNYDPIIAGKEGWLNTTFFLVRMVFFFVGWYMIYYFIRKESILEDLNGGYKHYRKMVKLSGFFIVFFAVSSSMSAWDWVLSIDTHWFSTMFGWYVFASYFVTALAAITYAVVLLKEAGYLSIVNENHLHDLGKYVFAFSIFWTYIWFSQFLLIYYANIPEETIYFIERLSSDHYSKFIFINLILNFAFPFLFLMTREAKRKIAFLKIVCPVVIVGHWFDFYLMITPGTLKSNGGFGFVEIGITMIYLAVFIFVIMKSLTKANLIAKNHPMLDESIHHHI